MTEPAEYLTLEAGSVRALRDEKEISVFEARSILLVDVLNKAIDEAKTVDDIKVILRTMLRSLAKSIQ